MKRFFKKMGSFVFLITMMLVCRASACDPDPDENKVLSIDKSDLKAFKSDGETQYVDVLAENVSWSVEVEEDGSWLNAKKDGSRIKLTAEKNTTESDRSTTVKVNCETDNNLSKEFTVKQEGLKRELSVSGLDAPFEWQKGSIENAQVLSITCNASWTIEGKPNWLDIDALSGTGSKTVKVWTNEENNTTEQRNAVLIIKSGSITIEKQVSQRAGYDSKLTVTPKTVVALANSIAFDYEYGSSVSRFARAVYPSKTVERYTDDEIITVLSQESRLTPSDDYVTSIGGMYSSTDYVICIVAYDKNGKSGKLVREPVRTKSGSNQAYVYIENITYDDDYWYWDTNPNGFVTKYYIWNIGENSRFNQIENDASIAWFFQERMKQYPDNYQPIVKGDSWRAKRSRERVFDVVTWAVDVDGNFSGLISREQGQVNASRMYNSKSYIQTTFDYKKKDYLK